MARFTGRSVLVTGSSQGIGAACARRFAKEGANVVINGRKESEETKALLAELQAMGQRCVFVAADVGTAAAAATLVAQAVEAIGVLDVLVNNAGVERSSDFWDTTEEDYDLVMDTNVKGPFFVTQAFVKHCRAAARKGAVVNMSSVHEELAFPHFASYCASKGAMRMLTRDLANELAPLGIRINNVAPGAIATPINRHLMDTPELLRPLQAKIPLGRLGQADEVAALVAFLASEEAAYVTGSTYFVDGGLSVSYSEQ
ncbi:glucose 1-dehydrogenase [Xylophilus rhododendri]|uniref:Glucose 1-dehydrogenase n=1 Tax=Xylophilus rhododendri TaxID=2697032 RepID=A0A857J9Z2_9BURK|nr:glucose 1-dehydrogenase [Xylophilus rhododendri]QHI99859.1 glucose 1-dehydrogenase [Xylophilus rhododendri]